MSGPRAHASRQMRWSEAQLRRMFAAAEDLGHSISTIPVQQGNSAALCSCGWQSNSRKRVASVLVLSSLHVGDVLGENVPGQMVGPVPVEPARDAGRVAG